MIMSLRSKLMRTVTRFLGLFMAALCLTMLLPLQWSAPAHAATNTTTIYASKDKYLNDQGGFSYGPAGSDAYLYVGDQKGYIFGVNKTAVCFNLSDIVGKNISAAYLKLGTKYCSYGGTSIDVYGSDNDAWTEGYAYNISDKTGGDPSFPAEKTLLTPAHYSIPYDNTSQTKWYSIDVTSFIQSEAAGDQLATLVLTPAITGTYNEVDFSSREGLDPIQLLVEYKVPSAALSASSAVTESNVNGAGVTVALEDGVTFSDTTLDKANFSLNGAPFTISEANYTDSTHCNLTLAYNGADFDSNKSISVTIGSTELSTGSSLTTNTIDVTATNDAESITATPTVTIEEGSENNKVINVTLTGGKLASTLTDLNWSVSGLPAGVSKGTVTRVDNTHATVTLSGNATRDYDSNITATVSCEAAEYTDNTGGDSLSADFTLTATNDVESIAATPAVMIAEGNENNKVINVTLTGGQLAATLTPSNWSVSGLPAGVSKGAVTRVNNTHATVTLSGNATVDYDNDITATVSCTKSEYTDNTDGSTISANFTLTSTNDAESITAATDGMIAEGSEDNEVINVTLSGGQLADVLTPSNWTVTGLPAGVSMGTVSRIDNNHAKVTLSGNTTGDYDNDITATVSCTEAEYADSTGGGAISASFMLTATNDAESFSVATDGAIAEGAENGEIITVTLTNGTFAEPIAPSNWTLTGLPDGVTKGAVTRVNAHTVTIALSGNARDYDNNKTVTVSCTADQYEDSTGGGAMQGFFTLNAVNDAESISASNDGQILEGSEDGEVITATLSGGAFVDPVTTSDWTVSGLPSGVTIGTVARINDNTVKISLSGNATEDYDSDLNVTVSCTAAAYLDSTGGGTLSSNGVTIKALDDEESLSAASSGLITEGSEDGKTIIVTLAGGTFKSILAAANWTVNGLPEGVSRGEVTRVSKNTAEIKLSGNALRDYDDDIALTVICKGIECANNTHDGDLSAAGAVLTAIKEANIPQPVNVVPVAAGKIPTKAKTDTALTIVPPAAPRGYTVVSITYSSTRPSVASVDASGNVTFLTSGKTTIITKVISQMTDSRGRVKTKTTTIKKNVTVSQPITSISLNQDNATIARKQKLKLIASVAPYSASNKKVKWTSSNPKAASVSGSGVVTGKAAGTTVITCTAKDGSGVLASCTVMVTPVYPSGLKLSKTALALKTGRTYILKAKVLPAAADFKTVTWVSSNPAVTTVNAKGKIKAVAPGTAVITATTSNGLTLSCTVTVQ